MNTNKCTICGSTDGVEMTLTAVTDDGPYYELICATCKPDVEVSE